MSRLPRFRLWHSLDARSLRVLWTFEELFLQRGRDYALHAMRFPPRQHHPEFIERNPLGTVPWFEHMEPGEPQPRTSMSESCAVPLYLAELHGSRLALRSGDEEYGSFLNWVHHAETLTFPQAIVMRYALFERERGLHAAAEDYARWFHARLRLPNTALADGRAFLVGDRFTLADVTITYALFNASADGLCGGGMAARGDAPLGERFKPQVAEYLQRMTERPAWVRAQREQLKDEDRGETRAL